MTTRRSDCIFRVTRSNGRVTLGYKRNLTAQLGGQKRRHYTGDIVKIEATNADATIGWTDVTSEFPGISRQRSQFQVMEDPLGEE